MADKLNIYLDVSNLTIVGDEFRYKYSYDDIIYMITNITANKNKLQSHFDRLETKLNAIGTELNTCTGNIAMLIGIKNAIEAENPSLYEEEIMEEEPPLDESHIDEEPPFTGNFSL